MPFYFVFKKHKITEYACHKHMTSNYHCIQRVVQIISMNKRIIHKSAAVLMGIFMHLINLVGYIFIYQKTHHDLNVACNLLHE